jgi:hypothetical protein
MQWWRSETTASTRGMARMADRLRKRRGVRGGGRIKGNWTAAFVIGKECSMDEMVRNHRHWHCMRLKFKPNMHSGFRYSTQSAIAGRTTALRGRSRTPT